MDRSEKNKQAYMKVTRETQREVALLKREKYIAINEDMGQKKEHEKIKMCRIA